MVTKGSLAPELAQRILGLALSCQPGPTQKMRIVTIMVIRRMKASPNGFMATALTGLKYPRATARTMANAACTHKDL